MHSPEAIFDVLSIVASHRQAGGSIGRINIQRTAYLSCLLALYRGKPIADWGYRFSKTEFGTPFSAEINDAVEYLSACGALGRTEHGDDRVMRFSISESGTAFLGSLRSMRNLNNRSQFLDAAFDSGLIASPATLAEGIDNEPTVRRALQGEQGKALLEGPAVKLLHEQFEALAEIIGPGGEDLITPSVVWLSYIAGQGPTRRKPEVVHGA